MTTNSFKLMAVSSLMIAGIAISAPALATVDPMSLPPCDFSNGVPQGMTMADLQAIANNKADYLNSANPICNPKMGKGEFDLPLPGNEDKTISWPVPVSQPQTLSAQVQQPILPVTGASDAGTILAGLFAAGAGLVAFLRHR